MYSQIEENYLKTIFKLSLDTEGFVSTSAIAGELNINSASVTDMIQKKLLKKGLVEYVKYQGVNLSDKGRGIAVNVVRKHRIWEVFLSEKLKFKWSEVHDLAEQLEHIQSDELIDRLDNFLGNPAFDPHGGAIPGKDGKIRSDSRFLLSELKPHAKVKIVAVKDDSKELLQHLEHMQLLLGTEMEIVKVLEFDRSIILTTPNGRQTISGKAAKHLYVKIL